MDKRQKLLNVLIPTLLVLALLGVALWGNTQKARADKYQLATEAQYRRAYAELLTEVGELDAILSKIQVAGTRAQFTLLLSNAWNTSGRCVGLLAQIPASHLDSSDVNSFLIRVSDYANTLTNKLAHGGTISSKELDKIGELRSACNKVTADLAERYFSNKLSVELLDSNGYFTTAAEVHKNEAAKIDYPTIIYDGPFSESTEKAEAKGLRGGMVDEAKAKKEALNYAPDGTNLTSATTSVGAISSFDFSGTTKDGREIDISVSQKGGDIVWMMSSATTDMTDKPSDKEVEECKDAGVKYLKDKGYDNMRPTYVQYYNGAVVINFAATQNGVILYNDLVKLWIDRETNEIFGVDARNYLFSHTTRDLPARELTMGDAETYISDKLK
ncbi:MAG: hypothetical protein GX802_00005, partial [Clostridiales bacterium]|nr:hypothetical protein [Clostridiales bacterium]